MNGKCCGDADWSQGREGNVFNLTFRRTSADTSRHLWGEKTNKPIFITWSKSDSGWLCFFSSVWVQHPLLQVQCEGQSHYCSFSGNLLWTHAYSAHFLVHTFSWVSTRTGLHASMFNKQNYLSYNTHCCSTSFRPLSQTTHCSSRKAQSALIGQITLLWLVSCLQLLEM